MWRVVRRIDDVSDAAPRGQVLILFAMFLVVLIGMAGLATDLGYAFAQRRAMQNSADAASEAGALVVLKAAQNNTLSAQADAKALANANAGKVAPKVNCSYVDDNDTVLGDCSAAVPATATGVKVAVTETHDTFFMQAVPGAPKTVTTSASATAHVQLMMSPPQDGPFIVCGVGSQTAKGKTVNILQSQNGKWVFNQNATDQTFVIHGPQVPGCNTQGDRFKGLANQDANEGRTTPGWFAYDTGTKAGPTRSTVAGIQGCQKDDAPDQCVLILPVAVDQPPEQGNSKQVYVVGYAAFYVTQVNANTHDGKLLMGYDLTGAGQPGWTPTSSGPVVIRVTQ